MTNVEWLYDMQNPTTSLITFREVVYGFIATSLASVIAWLLGRRKSNAEAVHIHAQSVKVSAEAQQVSTHTIIEAQNTIAELLQINSALRDELTEANRRQDNVEFELRTERFERAQLETRTRLLLIQSEQMYHVLKLNGLNYDNSKAE